jgi:tripartite-type tricarboxylate transporter receptor subunit TctC
MSGIAAPEPRPRRALLAAAAASLMAPRALCADDGFPTRPIRVVLPFGAGGIADILSRPMAEHVREALGQPVVVDPRPGSGGILAAEIVARAPKDGHTVGYMAHNSLVTAFALGMPLPYRVEDFQPLTSIFRAPQVLAVAHDVPARSVAELVELAKRPGQSISYGTPGRGSSGHILMEALRGGTGAVFDNVVYRTEAVVPTEMIAGHIPAYMGSLLPVLQHHLSGDLRILAVTTPERLPAVPDVPTFRELGLPFMTYTYFHGLALPAGTPAPIVRRLHAAFAAAILSGPVRARMSPDMVPAVVSPEEFAETIRRETAEIAAIVRARGISLG